MSPLEEINQASQQLVTASRSQAKDILCQLIAGFSSGSYLTTSGNIVDETGATTPDFEAVVHAKYDPDPKHPTSIPANAAAVAFCIYDNMTVPDLHAAYDKIKQAKSLKKKPSVGGHSTITLGIILALKTDLTLNQIADEIEQLNAGTPDRVWTDMVTVVSSGILNYQGQFVTQDMGGDWLPPAEGATANQTMPIYVVTILKPTGNYTLHALLHYMMGHLTFFGAAPQLTNITSALDNLPKNGVVRQGYQYNLSGVLRPVPEEMHRDKMMPTLPLLILGPNKKELGQILYVKWQDGGLIVLRGQIPLEGIVVFLSDAEIMKKLRVTKLPDVQLSNILPLSEVQFRQMLINFQQRSNMTISTPPGKFVLQHISDEGTQTPIVARAFLGILKLREAAIVKQPERDNFDTAYQNIYHELIELRDTAATINRIWCKHRAKITSGEIIRQNGQHIQILESIDRQLKSEVSNFLNVAARVVRNNMQTLLKNQGVDVGFVFKTSANAFQDRLAALRTTDPFLADYMEQVRRWSEPLILVRNDLLEHGTFTFPKVTYDLDRTPMEAKQPEINCLPVGNYANLVYDRIACFVEELTVFCLQKKLPAGITLEEIPLSSRPQEDLERFQITIDGRGVNRWNLAYTTDRFEEK